MNNITINITAKAIAIGTAAFLVIRKVVKDNPVSVDVKLDRRNKSKDGSA